MVDGDASDNVSIDWNTDDDLDVDFDSTFSPPRFIEVVADNYEASSSSGGSPSKLAKKFVAMGFAQEMVLKVIEENGEDTDVILNTLLTYKNLESEDSPQPQLGSNSDPSSSEAALDGFSDMESWSEDEIKEDTKPISEKHKRLLALENTGSLSENEKKLLTLAGMGYDFDEAELAMERYGAEASIADLIEFIGVAQIAREECYQHEDDLKKKYVSTGTSTSKKRKILEICKKKNTDEDLLIRLPNPMIGFGVPSQQLDGFSRSIPLDARGPPYFYYENVALAPKGVWDTISRFLYEIEPEFVDSKYFSATARKRGYIHNLPIEKRFPLVPLPPMTIKQAFPLSKKWWPSWDPREKMNCIQTAIGSAKMTERIRSQLERYPGDPPESVQKYVLEQCRKWNLVWVGRNKLAVLECDEVEMLLGFPKNHTRGGGISRTDRYKSLGNSFQVDTVAYHLSVLKDMYPDGMNILTLFSGIGGGEVALHRLGVKLKNVVSVEKSKANRDIVRSWWEQTNQTGELYDFDDIVTLHTEKLETIMGSIGRFDLVIGGSPCNNLAGSNRHHRDGLEGKESSLFYEYFRILKTVREFRPR